MQYSFTTSFGSYLNVKAFRKNIVRIDSEKSFVYLSFVRIVGYPSIIAHGLFHLWDKYKDVLPVQKVCYQLPGGYIVGKIFMNVMWKEGIGNLGERYGKYYQHIFICYLLFKDYTINPRFNEPILAISTVR